ncbi:MAG: hypothetical protein LUC90_09895 [Lachnospiraceae bacterium]|nr:hypothetical protein [Lachnospiraceae bacterium]
MDKAEYRIRTDEIKDLIADGEYEEAAAIADEIDWRRVKSVKMLCIISDLYKINRRYEDARNILLIAYEKTPQSRTILYALCELSIRLQDLLNALEYYKAFVQAAPQDSGRYVLQYRLYQAQEVSIEERIAVLEELKKAEYTERWGYELAYLYHRAGMVDECVRECDELILWFGEGKYVTKAMELKMNHEPLTEAQQYKYDHREMRKSRAGRKSAPKDLKEQPAADGSMEPATAKSGLKQPVKRKNAAKPQESRLDADVLESPTTEIPELQENEGMVQEPEEGAELSERQEASDIPEPEEISVKTMDVENKFSTMNLQKELAASLQELLGEVRQQTEPALDEEASPQEIEEEVVLFEQEAEPETEPEASGGVRFDTKDISDSAEKPAEKVVEIYREPVVLAPETASDDENGSVMDPEPKLVEPVHIMEVQYPNQDDSMVSMTRMEGDGQIGMILPEPVKEEQQIKGQLSIEDILAEWDRKDQQAEEEHKAEIYERIKAQTGEIFAEFDAKKKEDILTELQFLADEQEEREAQEFEEQDIFGDPEEGDVWAEEEEQAPEEDLFSEEEEIEETGDDSDILEGLDDLLSGEDETAEKPEPDLEIEEPEDASKTEETEPEEPMADSTRGVSSKEEAPEKYRRFIHSDESFQQIKSALENTQLPVSSGNIIVEGDNYDYCFEFIKQLLFDLKAKGMELSGKLARISAVNLNRKKTVQIMDTLESGAMVIEHVSMLNADKTQDIEDILRTGERKLLLILVDTPDAIREFLSRRPVFQEAFTVQVKMQGLSAKELVQYGSSYADSKEYVIDEMALLALQTRIEEEEANNNVPMPEDVEKMVDAAIRHVNRIGMRKFLSTLSGSRYNEEDMIILKEQDFA